MNEESKNTTIEAKMTLIVLIVQFVIVFFVMTFLLGTPFGLYLLYYPVLILFIANRALWAFITLVVLNILTIISLFISFITAGIWAFLIMFVPIASLLAVFTAVYYRAYKTLKKVRVKV